MKKHFLTAGFLLATLVSSPALLLNFDSGLLVGTGEPLSSGFTFNYGSLETEDSNGDPVTPFYAIDPTASPVTAYAAADINTLGYGPATTPALGAYDQLILMTFDTPVDLSSFRVDLDNSSFGDFNRSILFYDNADVQLASLPLAQTTAGGTYSLSAPLVGVKKIVLPTTGFYDNLVMVPEPSMTMLAGLGALGLGLRRRRAGV